MTWKKGQSGNPAGRPIGSRDKITEAFLRDLAEDWQEHGKQAIERVYDAEPATYLRIVSALVPREHKLSSEFNVAALIQVVSERQAKKMNEVKTIEHHSKSSDNAKGATLIAHLRTQQ